MLSFAEGRKIFQANDILKGKGESSRLSCPKGLTPREVYYYLFSELKNGFKSKGGKQYNNFTEYIYGEFGDTDLVMKPLGPTPPEFYHNLELATAESVAQCKDYSFREISFTHPVNEIMGPKNCRYEYTVPSQGPEEQRES